MYNQICYALSKICLAAQYLFVDISLCNNNNYLDYQKRYIATQQRYFDDQKRYIAKL